MIFYIGLGEKTIDLDSDQRVDYYIFDCRPNEDESYIEISPKDFWNNLKQYVNASFQNCDQIIFTKSNIKINHHLDKSFFEKNDTGISISKRARKKIKYEDIRSLDDLLTKNFLN